MRNILSGFWIVAITLGATPLHAERARAVVVPAPAPPSDLAALCSLDAARLTGGDDSTADELARLRPLCDRARESMPIPPVDARRVREVRRKQSCAAVRAALKEVTAAAPQDGVCRDRHVQWFPASCAFLKTDDDELPVVFGTGLRAAFAADLAQLPRRLIDGFPRDLRGSGRQLLAVLFVESVKLLIERPDIYEVAHQMTALTSPGEDQFTCHAGDTECAAVRRALAVGAGARPGGRGIAGADDS
jgi:hypothetical protein